MTCPHFHATAHQRARVSRHESETCVLLFSEIVTRQSSRVRVCWSAGNVEQALRRDPSLLQKSNKWPQPQLPVLAWWLRQLFKERAPTPAVIVAVLHLVGSRHETQRLTQFCTLAPYWAHSLAQLTNRAHQNCVADWKLQVLQTPSSAQNRDTEVRVGSLKLRECCTCSSPYPVRGK